jgi:hypothetical protein
LVWDNDRMLGVALLTSLLAAPGAPATIAVLTGHAPGDDPTEALAATSLFAPVLRAQGVAVAAGAGLWRGLGHQLREVGSELPVGAERILDDAGQAFDEGNFAAAAKLAQDAVSRLDHAPRSVAVEARERAAEILCGLALAETGQMALAAPHLVWTLVREPAFALDPVRFAPPQHRDLEEARRVAALLPHGSLTVTGTAGASVYVDGLLSGQAPVTLTGLASHGAWIWLERAGRRSLAHRVGVGGGSTSVSIDLDLEARLAMGPEQQPIFTALAGDPETPGLLARLARALVVPAVAVLSRCAGAGCWQIDAVASGRTISLHRSVAAGKRPPLEDLARELLAEAVAAPAPPEIGSKLTPEPEEAAVAVTTAAAQPQAEAPESSARPAKVWPWVVAAVAVAAIGAGVGLYFALQPSNDVSVWFRVGLQ